jgi:phytoene/squalene synthetase
MTGMGDLGRELDQIRDNPQPVKPRTELDELEARLAEFFAWAHGRSHPEIRSRFASDFSSEPLHDDAVAAMSDGRAAEVRDQLPIPPTA